MRVKAGQERSKAFNALIRRTGVEDVKSLAAMIVQSERFDASPCPPCLSWSSSPPSSASSAA